MAKRVVHLKIEGDKYAITACGTLHRGAVTVTKVAEQVTCAACPRTIRWKTRVLGMSHAEAIRKQ